MNLNYGVKTIKQLQKRAELILITDFQETDNLRKEFPGYDAFFVRSKNGEYIEVWGFVGVIPYLSKLVSRLV